MRPLIVLVSGAALAAAAYACTGEDAVTTTVEPNADASNTPTDGATSDGPTTDGPTTDAGLDAARTPRIAFEVNDQSVNVAEARVALPPWLGFTSPSVDKTTQVSPSDVKVGIGADVPRMRDVGTGRGLALEPARSNECFPSEPPVDADAGPGVWYVDPGGTPVSSVGLSSPDGTANASSLGLGDENYGPRTIKVPAATGARTWSLWLKRLGGSTTHMLRSIRDSANNGGWPFTGFGGTWARDSNTQSLANETSQLAFDTRAAHIPADQGMVTLGIYGAQYEGGSYPSSLIRTTTAARTRLGESLFATNAPVLTPAGSLDMEIVFAPHFATNENVADLEILYFDAESSLTLGANQKLSLHVAGVTLETPPLTWKRNEAFVVIAKSSPAGQSLEVRIGSAPPVALSGPAAPPLPLPAKIVILGSLKGTLEGADLRALRAY